MRTTQFWTDALERALRTAAQAALGVLGGGVVGLLTTDWVGVGSVAGGAAVFSLLMSIGAEKRGNPGTASMTKAVELTNEHHDHVHVALRTEGGKGASGSWPVEPQDGTGE